MGELLHGGQWYMDASYPLDQMPVFVRPGARIPLYPADVDSTDEMDLSKAITLEINDEFKGYNL